MINAQIHDIEFGILSCYARRSHIPTSVAQYMQNSKLNELPQLLLWCQVRSSKPARVQALRSQLLIFQKLRLSSQTVENPCGGRQFQFQGGKDINATRYVIVT
ncbi:hypothetical protein V6Z98_000449 [Aspergillus fumigatus]